MKYKNTIGTCLILLPGMVAAQTFGIGISVKSSDTSIYFPYKINETLILEPYISHKSSKITDANITTKNTQTLIGLGLITRKSMSNNAFFYYGARLTYIKNKTTNDALFNFITPNAGDTSGYQIEPLVGISYYITNNILLRGEASFFYNKTDGDGFNTFPSQNNNIEKTNSGTSTRLLISYYF